MQLIDTHTHLDFPEFADDLPQVLARSRAVGVTDILVAGVHAGHWERMWQLVCAQPGLHAAFGLHPLYVAQHQDADLQQLRDWLQRLQGDARLCAVGEFGLDWLVAGLDRERQQQLFEAQLRLACEFGLPVLLHVRRAHAQTIATLKRLRPPRGGIIHAFAGSAEEAREYVKLGFCLGLGGAASWPQATRLRRVVAQLPLESIVLETDAPDMTPAMHAGQRNSPEFLGDICQVLAELRGQDVAELAAAACANTARLFRWRLD